MVPKSERFELRLDEEQLNRIGSWADAQDDHPSKAEAIRRLVDLGLSIGDKQSVHFSDGEKVLLVMMRDVYKALKIRDSDIDPDFMADVIFGGHNWAPKWKMTGLFHGHADDPRNLSHVVDVLDMWSFIETAIEKLSSADKQSLADQVGPRGTHVQFPGFDGNHESEQMAIASFLVNKMEHWDTFKGRKLNSHHPTYARYRQMVELFEPMRETLIGKELSLKQLVTLLSV